MKLLDKILISSTILVAILSILIIISTMSSIENVFAQGGGVIYCNQGDPRCQSHGGSGSGVIERGSSGSIGSGICVGSQCAIAKSGGVYGAGQVEGDSENTRIWTDCKFIVNNILPMDVCKTSHDGFGVGGGGSSTGIGGDSGSDGHDISSIPSQLDGACSLLRDGSGDGDLGIGNNDMPLSSLASNPPFQTCGSHSEQ